MTTTVLIAETNTDCLHCIVHTVIRSYLKANPECSRDQVLSHLIAVVTEFMVAVSKSPEDLRVATESFIQQIPDAMLIALESFPTSGRTQ